jgi:hypothetical protein
MSLGSPFQPGCSVVVNTIALSATNTQFNSPAGSDIWVVNPNTATSAFVTLNANTGTGLGAASSGNGVNVPAGKGIMLKAPWVPGTTGGFISAIYAVGPNTGSVFASAGFGTGAQV